MRRIGHQPLLNQNAAPPLPQPINVHRAPADKVLQRLEKLRRTGRVGAAVHRIPLRLDNGGIALRAMLRHPKLRPPFLPRLRRRAYHLGNNIAGPFNLHPVANPDVLAANVLLIMQRRVLHRSPADHHRLQNSLRVQAAGAPHADHNV